MKVKELIQKLQSATDKDAEVYFIDVKLETPVNFVYVSRGDIVLATIGFSNMRKKL